MNITKIAPLLYLAWALIMPTSLLSCTFIPKHSSFDYSSHQMMPQALSNLFQPLPIEYHFDNHWYESEFIRDTYLSPIVPFSHYLK